MIEFKEEDFGMDADLKNFPLKCQNVMKKTARKVGREGVNKMKEASPKRRPKYANGWSLRDKSSYNGTAGDIEFIIHNKKYHGLVHLLDDGHMLVYMGRYTEKFIPGDKHFTNTSKEVGEEYVRSVEEALDSID